jgi:hypothetical protein
VVSNAIIVRTGMKQVNAISKKRKMSEFISIPARAELSLPGLIKPFVVIAKESDIWQKTVRILRISRTENL